VLGRLKLGILWKTRRNAGRLSEDHKVEKGYMTKSLPKGENCSLGWAKNNEKKKSLSLQEESDAVKRKISY